MFTVSFEGEDLVLRQGDREFARTTVPLNGDLDGCLEAVTTVTTPLQYALDEVVRQAWRARVLDRTDGFHR